MAVEEPVNILTGQMFIVDDLNGNFDKIVQVVNDVD